LEHSNTANTKHPFLHIACKKECYKKALRHYSNRSGNPKDQNIPWNHNGKEGENDLNNSKNILLTWLQQPNNYAKFRSLPSGKTKVGVCQEIFLKIRAANTLKSQKPHSIQLKIQSLNHLFYVALDWVNNMGAGVLERDGQSSFEETVKKKFHYYYDLVDYMANRALSRPISSSDNVLAESSSSSSSASSSKGLDKQAEEERKNSDEDNEKTAKDDESLGFPHPTFESPPSPPIGTSTNPSCPGTSTPSPTSPIIETGTIAVNSSLTTDDSAGSRSVKTPTDGKRKKESTSTTKKKVKKTKGAASLASHFVKKQGSGADVVHYNNRSWQVSMLDIWRGEVELAQVKWDSQDEATIS
jgi:hypothetical protein